MAAVAAAAAVVAIMAAVVATVVVAVVRAARGEGGTLERRTVGWSVQLNVEAIGLSSTLA